MNEKIKKNKSYFKIVLANKVEIQKYFVPFIMPILAALYKITEEQHKVSYYRFHEISKFRKKKFKIVETSLSFRIAYDAFCQLRNSRDCKMPKC